MSTISFNRQTQAFSTWGEKLMQHADRLHEMQSQKVLRPITVQLAPTEGCDSDCPFCSVQNRPIREKIPWAKIESGLTQFRAMGAKAVELTGGGNPLLYRDGTHTINDIIDLAHDLGLDIGIITNTEKLSRHIKEGPAKKVKWIRVSMIKLDEGKNPEDYDFSGFEGRVGLSYIAYEKTTPETIHRISRVVDLNPHIRFVRLAANCLNDDALTMKAKWGEIVKEADKHGRMFIKEIDDNYHAYPGGCWVGGIRPYWVHDGVYICTSHVLIHRTYHPTWKLCGHDDIPETWRKMSERMSRGLPPYDIDIAGECRHCYYANNNKIIHSVVEELPDKNFA